MSFNYFTRMLGALAILSLAPPLYADEVKHRVENVLPGIIKTSVYETPERICYDDFAASRKPDGQWDRIKKDGIEYFILPERQKISGHRTPVFLKRGEREANNLEIRCQQIKVSFQEEQIKSALSGLSFLP